MANSNQTGEGLKESRHESRGSVWGRELISESSKSLKISVVFTADISNMKHCFSSDYKSLQQIILMYK